MAGFLFRLETVDGAPAEPPTFATAVPNWPVGSQIYFHGRTLRVIGRRDDGTWKDKALRWDKRPAGQGRWTAERERAGQDNATVRTQGLLAPSERIRFQRDCFMAWNRLPREAW